MKKLRIVTSVFFLLCNLLIAKTITGTVTGEGLPLPGVTIVIKGSQTGTVTDFDGLYSIEANVGDVLSFSSLGFENKEVTISISNIVNMDLIADVSSLEEIEVVGYLEGRAAGVRVNSKRNKKLNSQIRIRGLSTFNTPSIQQSTSINYSAKESYAYNKENDFKDPLQTPLSTFSIDVDAAAYSNMRRFIMNGDKPPKDAVRIEEMINYFNYDYPQPINNDPFSINYEVANCPWNVKNKLVHVGLQGKTINMEDAPANNLVFLIDVSGSMGDYNKLPLLKKAFKLLVNKMRKKDRISIVVYAGSSGLVLPSTGGDKKEEILRALDNLQSGGSTAGAEGLELAYQVAEKNFIPKGNNRIILATDGDFNVGQSSNNQMEKLIVSKRDKGIFISVTGFGMGNYKDEKMEIIADKGNGNYSYIDNLLEAKKVFVNEFGGTLFTIAKDVKIQIEFNPLHVKKYRLIGYENRLLNEEDFEDDKKDAGELGAGHTVTALYEIVPAESGEKRKSKLKYQTTNRQLTDELATIKFRYKLPKETSSKLITKTIPNVKNVFENTSFNFQFSSAVASFGMLLKNSKYKNEISYAEILKIAKSSKGEDTFGYRAEFIQLVELASQL